MSIGVVLVDDERLVRAGLRMILQAESDIVVVGEAGDGAAAVDLVRDLHPDVVLMDVQMPVMNGIEATRAIVSAAASAELPARVLVLTTFDLDEYVYEAFRAGASGFLLKRAPAEELIAGVRAVAEGDGMVSPSVTIRLIERFRRDGGAPKRDDDQIADLTPRESEVFALIARGLSNQEIAARLYLSEGTVKTHVKRLFAKLNLHDRAQAVIMAYEIGLVRPGDDDALK